MDFEVGELKVLEEFNSWCMYSAPYSYLDYNGW